MKLAIFAAALLAVTINTASADVYKNKNGDTLDTAAGTWNIGSDAASFKVSLTDLGNGCSAAVKDDGIIANIFCTAGKDELAPIMMSPADDIYRLK